MRRFQNNVQLSCFQVFTPKSIVDSLFRERRKLNKTRNVVKHTKSVPGGNICLNYSVKFLLTLPLPRGGGGGGADPPKVFL